MSVKKPIIAIDIDDVLADHAGGFVAFSNEKWGSSLRVEDYDEHWAKLWDIEHNLDEVVRRRDMFVNSGAHCRFLPIGNAYDVLSRLSSRYMLHVTTSRLLTMKDNTAQWLSECYGDIFNDQTIHYAGIWDTLTKNSHTVTKADLIDAIDAQYLIDDQLKHCEAVAGAGKIALLFGDYRWNQAKKLHPNIVRVKNWREVEEYFNDESAKR
jgi:5'(3')-deoxyribonucleotidase